MKLIARNKQVLPDIGRGTSLEEVEDALARERGTMLRLRVLKFNGEVIKVQVPEDRATLSGIRRRIERAQRRRDERINWRYIWNHYCLCLGDRYLLVNNMNLDLKKLGLRDNSELAFKKLIRRRTSHGPLKLRDSRYLII